MDLQFVSFFLWPIVIIAIAVYLFLQCDSDIWLFLLSRFGRSAGYLLATCNLKKFKGPLKAKFTSIV